jgi:hypothetical protein
MTIYNIFYDSNKEITWSSTAGITDAIKTEQKNTHGLDYAAVDCSETPVGEKFYMNSDGDDIVEKTAFTPSFSTTTPDLDATVTVTGVPAGTEVFLDGTSTGTMSDTTLTFTAQEAGGFSVVLKKRYYYDYIQELTVKRYGE